VVTVDGRWLSLAVAALSLTPVLAFDAASTGGRAHASAVAADGSAYLAVTNLGPSAASPVLLVTANDFEDNAMTLRNQYTAPVAVQATLATNPDGRFVLPNPSATLAPGAQHTLKIQDDHPQHPRVCTSVTVRVDGYVGGAGPAREGHSVVSRAVFVKVRATC
jgi:hypothetical protein